VKLKFELFKLFSLTDMSEYRSVRLTPRGTCGRDLVTCSTPHSACHCQCM